MVNRMIMSIFQEKNFLGFINEIDPQCAGIYFPAKENGENAVCVGGFVIIRDGGLGFLARLTQMRGCDIRTQNDYSRKEAFGKAELLLVFRGEDFGGADKTVFSFPSVGAKVYSCPQRRLEEFIQKSSGKKFAQTGENGHIADLSAPLGRLVPDNALCNISLNSLFGRHCAVVGTTGGGKSWTVAKLMEETLSKTGNKIILFDAAGEYGAAQAKTVVLGKDSYFPYRKLSVNDLFILLRPGGESQKTVLLEAVRSLKIMKLSGRSGTFKKAYQQRKEYNDFYEKNISAVEDNSCDFDINCLVPQIKEECVAYFAQGWGPADAKLYDKQASLVNRTVNLINTDVFNKLFGFRNVPQGHLSIIDIIEDFISGGADKRILRIDLGEVSPLFFAKEITANAIGSYLLNKARKKVFRNSPVLLVVDEAHQFMNKKVTDEHFDSLALDAFDLIAKECRKYGLFLCLATQMPKEIPEGTLSQIGSFIVHRLINEADKKVIENAVSPAGKNLLSFLPSLGEGEALLMSVNLAMPLIIKMDRPKNPPVYDTPRLSAADK